MKTKKVYKCSVCHKPGHNKLECPELTQAANELLPAKKGPGSMTARELVTQLRLEQTFLGDMISRIEKIA